MSERPTDGEVSRALNALVMTLGEQRADQVDRARWQQIVTGALGGEELISVRPDGEAPTSSAHLVDRAGRVLGSVRRERGRWFGERAARLPAPRAI